MESARRALLYASGSVASVLLAFLLTSVFLLFVGRNPVEIYSGIISGAFGDQFSFSETLVAATPIMLCALGVAVPGWLGLMNVGVEGQLYLGAIGATFVALFFPHNMAAWAMLTLMGVSACAAGAAFSAIPGVLKVWLNVNEVIVSLLLNYVAILMVEFLIHGPWQDPSTSSWPQTAEFLSIAQLQHFGSTRVHPGFVLAIVLCLLFAVFLPITKMGYIARVIGHSERAARYAHYSVHRYQLIAMLIAGAVAGLAGFGQVSAIEGRLRSGLSPGYGYTGFLVCWLSRHDPIAIIIVSILVGGLLSGADSLQLSAKLPFATVNILEGAIFFCLLASEQFVRKLAGTRIAEAQ